MTKILDYTGIMNHAMQFLVKKVMLTVAKNGLPGDHHFLITLSTKHPNIKLSAWLKEKYPEEITVVMQHWFENLVVGKKGFSVTLNFGNTPEQLYIPYGCIISFVDPSVEFGVKFNLSSTVDTKDEFKKSLKNTSDLDPAKNKTNSNVAIETDKLIADSDKAEIVQLHNFRKS